MKTGGTLGWDGMGWDGLADRVEDALDGLGGLMSAEGILSLQFR